MIDFDIHWGNFLPLYELYYKKIYHSNTHMAPFEALYGRGCKSPTGWLEVRVVKPLGVDLVKDSQGKVRSIPDKLLEAQSRQKKFLDHKIRDIPFQTVRMFFLRYHP